MEPHRSPPTLQVQEGEEKRVSRRKKALATPSVVAGFATANMPGGGHCPLPHAQQLPLEAKTVRGRITRNAWPLWICDLHYLPSSEPATASGLRREPGKEGLLRAAEFQRPAMLESDCLTVITALTNQSGHRSASAFLLKETNRASSSLPSSGLRREPGKEGLLRAAEFQRPAMLESDCLTVITALTNQSGHRSASAFLLKETIRASSSLPLVVFKHVKREELRSA
jgi:hypothetical protein